MKNYLFHKLFAVFMVATPLLFLSVAHSQLPVPDIKIDDLDGPLTLIPEHDSLSVSVQLDSAGRSDNADWFLAANTPGGLFFYTPEGWIDAITPAVQMGLLPLPNMGLMNFPASILPSGKYALYFAVDTVMDRVITVGQLYFDAVEFTILETGLPFDRRFVEASAGGTLRVTNTRGDEITLTLPPGSLRENTTIALTALNSKVPSPMANNLLPGVVLSPPGTVLKNPARLKVRLATPLADPKSSSLFLVRGPQLALPLGDRFFGSNALEGNIYHFSTIDAAGVTSQGEARNAVNAIATQAARDQGWHDTKANVKGLLEFQSMGQLLGYDVEGQSAFEEARSILSAECAAFLAQTVPQDPCATYAGAFFDRIELAQLLGIENCQDADSFFSSEFIHDRALYLYEQCDLLEIAGIWRLDPIGQHESCGYGGSLWPEDGSSGFRVRISQPPGHGSAYIEASYVPDAGMVLTGAWNADSGAFNLGTDTSDIAECGYLFYADDQDLCGDAIDCRLETCQIVTKVSGTLSSSDTISEAESNWFYSVTFSYGTPSSRGQTTWTCEGDATFQGIRQ